MPLTKIVRSLLIVAFERTPAHLTYSITQAPGIWTPITLIDLLVRPVNFMFASGLQTCSCVFSPNISLK